MHAGTGRVRDGHSARTDYCPHPQGDSWHAVSRAPERRPGAVAASREASAGRRRSQRGDSARASLGACGGAACARRQARTSGCSSFSSTSDKPGSFACCSPCCQCCPCACACRRCCAGPSAKGWLVVSLGSAGCAAGPRRRLYAGRLLVFRCLLVVHLVFAILSFACNWPGCRSWVVAR